MKKPVVIFFIFFCCTVSVYGQQLHVDSTRFITGTEPGAGDAIEYAIPTADKGILFAGFDVGNPRGIIPSFLLDTVEDNVFIGKIDSNQKISWMKVYGGSSTDAAMGACQTPDGGYAIIAVTSSADGAVTGFKGGNDIWLLRIDATGNLLWQKTYGSTQSDQAISIANTPDGGFIILGTSNGADGDVPFHYGSFWTFDWLVIKTDSAGNKQWAKTVGGTGDEQEKGAILSACGGYYIAGSTDSHDYDCNDNTWHPGVNTGYDYQLIKLDTAGNVLWDSSYGGSGGETISTAMYDARDSSIVICGGTHSNDYMVTGYIGGGDMWVVKVNGNGKLIWQKALGYATANGAYGICAASPGGYMAYGTTTVGTPAKVDAWAVLIDSNGNEITDKIFGGAQEQTPTSIVPYLNGYAATGNSNSTVFTEGTTYGNFENGGMYISYIDYWPNAVEQVTKNEVHLYLYPNPAKEYVNVIVQGNNGGTLNIINTIGQNIYRIRLKQSEQRTDINTDSWATGLYIVQWESDNGELITTKLIKN